MIVLQEKCTEITFEKDTRLGTIFTHNLFIVICHLPLLYSQTMGASMPKDAPVATAGGSAVEEQQGAIPDVKAPLAEAFIRGWFDPCDSHRSTVSGVVDEFLDLSDSVVHISPLPIDTSAAGGRLPMATLLYDAQDSFLDEDGSLLQLQLGTAQEPLAANGTEDCGGPAEALGTGQGPVDLNPTPDIMRHAVGDGDDMESLFVAEERNTLPLLYSDADAASDSMTAEEVSEATLVSQQLGRRVAVVGERVPQDAAYWRSPFRPRAVKTRAERIFLTDLLRRHPLFEEFPPFILELFVDAIELQETAPGEALIRQGDVHAFRFLLSGTVEGVLSPAPSESAAHTRSEPSTFGPGEFLQSEGLLHFVTARMTTPRRVPATLVATEPVTSWTLSRVQYKKIVMVHRLQAHQSVMAILDSLSFLDGLCWKEKLRLGEACEPVVLPQGTALLTDGEPTETVYLIISGMVEVGKQHPSPDGGYHVHLQFLTHSGTVGVEECFAPGGPICSNYDYVAHGEVSALRWHTGAILRLFGSHVRDVLGAQLAATLLQRSALLKHALEQTLVCQAVPNSAEEADFTEDMCPVSIKPPADSLLILKHFFTRAVYEGVTGVDRGVAIAAFTTRQFFPKGATLTSGHVPQDTDHIFSDSSLTPEAAEGGYLYVIARGAVDVFQKDVHITTLGVGDSYGELDVIGSPAGASAAHGLRAVVQSPQGCEVFMLSRKPYRLLLMRSFLQTQRAFRRSFSALSSSELFSDTYRTLICQGTRVIHLQSGDILLAAGDSLRFVYVLVDGRVRVVPPHGEPFPLCLREGDFVGALEVVDGLRTPPVTYGCVGRVSAVSVPAERFGNLFRPAMAEVEKSRGFQRYGFLAKGCASPLD